MLRSPINPLIAAAALALGACNPFRSPLKQEPVVQVTTNDVNVNSRWHGTLASPSNLAGAVQMTGQISITSPVRNRRPANTPRPIPRTART